MVAVSLLLEEGTPLSVRDAPDRRADAGREPVTNRLSEMPLEWPVSLSCFHEVRKMEHHQNIATFQMLHDDSFSHVHHKFVKKIDKKKNAKKR